MPPVLRKLLISLGVAFLVMFGYMFFDPTLREFVVATIISLYMMVFKVVVKFAFKKGVIAFATIAWERIFFVGGAALFKRFWINFAKKNAVEHVAKPLMPSARRWLAVHFDDFKEQPRWLQFSETTVGVIVIGTVGYLFGILSYLWVLVEKILTGKFQSFFLTILGTVTKSLKFVWNKISPWLDVIIMTVFLNFIEKIPFVRAIFYKTKEVKDKVVEKKDKAIQAVVHKPVNSVARAIENHAEKKVQKRKLLNPEPNCGIVVECKEMNTAP